MRPARPLIISLFLLAAPLGGTLVLGQSPPLTPTTNAAPSSLSDLIVALHAPKYSTRESATMALLRLGPEFRSDIELALSHATDAEEIARLKRVAVHLFMKGQTSLEGDVGLLGISLLLEPVDMNAHGRGTQMAVLVTKVQPGFPAAEVLEPCDRIIAVNGETLPPDPDTSAFRQYIKSTVPGHSLRMTLIRDGRLMTVDVRVAGLSQRDMASLPTIVEQRDQIADEYQSRLKTAAGPQTLVLRDGVSATRRSDGFIPASSFNDP